MSMSIYQCYEIALSYAVAQSTLVTVTAENSWCASVHKLTRSTTLPAGLPLLGHMHPPFFAIMDEIQVS